MVSQQHTEGGSSVPVEDESGDHRRAGSIREDGALRTASSMGRRVGDWQLEETIGKGGMGVVFRATHALIEGDFAVKMLRPELAQDESVLKRFLSEVQKSRLLDHPNIVRMEIPFRHDGAIFLPMELLRGRTLAELISDEPGAWPIDRTLDMIGQAATGIGHAHSRSVLHRDVKPENLFVTNTGRVKLLDFGLAKRIGDHTLTARGLAVGTPVYMAPEVLRGERPGTASDVYSLGMILFQLLTGQLPIPIQDTAATLAELFGPVLHAHERGLPRPSTFQTGVPEWLDDLSAKLLDKDPAVRPQTGNELARIFEFHPMRADGTETFDNPFARTASYPGPIDPTISHISRLPTSPGVPTHMGGDSLVPGLYGSGVHPTGPFGSGVHPTGPFGSGVHPLAQPQAGLQTGDIPRGANLRPQGWPVPAATADLIAPLQARRRWASILGASAVALLAAFALVVLVGDRPAPSESAPPSPAVAQAPTPATDEKLIAFSSVPPGAFVMVEGRVVCKQTPCNGRIAPGHRYVTMRLDRYQTYDQVVEIGESTSGVHAALEPLFGWLEVTTAPPGVNVAIDGEPWGPTPVGRRAVAPGRHSIEIRDQRYRRTTTAVTVERASTRRINLRPKRQVKASAEDFDAFFDLDVPEATPVSGGGQRKAP